MEFPITKEEVVKHLEELGYRNISDEKVDQFIQDLKRLIKYEEKKSRRKLKGKVAPYFFTTLNDF
jgi:Asp-tRNA(Asn)/Glu-tRNA(Gln) amidotransferase C subunit